MASDTGDYIVVQEASRGGGAQGEELQSGSSRNSPCPAIDLDIEGDVKMDHATGPTSETRRRRSTRTKPSGDQLDELRVLPEIRPIPWRAGKELSHEQSIEAQRVQTRGACLLVTRGEVRDPPCSHCSKELGRFSMCVASDDWFNGACATCQLATRANQCDFRRPDTLRIKSESRLKKQDSNELESIPKINSNASAPKKSELAPTPKPANSNNLGPENQIPIPPESSLEPSGLKKRKRKSELHKAVPLEIPKEQLQPTSAWKAYASPYRPAQTLNGTVEVPPPNSQPSTPNLYSSPYGLPAPNAIVSRPPEAPIIINTVYQKDDIQGHYRHYQPIAQAPRALPPIKHNNIRSRPSKHGPSGGFTAVNSRDRDATESLSPSIQLLQPTYSPPDPQLPVNVIIPKPMAQALTSRPTSQPTSILNTKNLESSLIDLLPRKKQKQIYSMMGGLQSGIRSCQQQADNMQRQLNALQAALGIDAEDGDLMGGT